MQLASAYTPPNRANACKRNDSLLAILQLQSSSASIKARDASHLCRGHSFSPRSFEPARAFVQDYFASFTHTKSAKLLGAAPLHSNEVRERLVPKPYTAPRKPPLAAAPRALMLQGFSTGSSAPASSSATSRDPVLSSTPSAKSLCTLFCNSSMASCRKLEDLPKLFGKSACLGELMSTALTCWPLSTSCGELSVFFLPF